jgi:monoterpene epsilon-lactone hydrolase
MLSIRARIINGFFRGLRRVGNADAMGEAFEDPVALQTDIVKFRKRADKPEPPRRLKRKRQHERLAVDGAPFHILTPTAGRQPRVLLYLHGGGYLIGPASLHWAASIKLADDVSADLAMLIYPKTPENDHRATIASAVDAFDVLVERYGAANIVVAGDSAGGGLSATLLTVLRETERPQPHAAILVSPWLDLSMSDPVAAEQAATDYVLTIDGAIGAGRLYAGERDPADALISPRFATTSGLAPIHMFVGTEEVFLADCRAFAAKARANGDRVTIQVLRKGQHVSAIFPTPEGRIARAQMVALIDWP